MILVFCTCYEGPFLNKCDYSKLLIRYKIQTFHREAEVLLYTQAWINSDTL